MDYIYGVYRDKKAMAYILEDATSYEQVLICHGRLLLQKYTRKYNKILFQLWIKKRKRIMGRVFRFIRKIKNEV